MECSGSWLNCDFCATNFDHHFMHVLIDYFNLSVFKLIDLGPVYTCTDYFALLY